MTGVPLAPLWFGWSFLKRFIFQSDGLRYFLGASCLSSLLKKLWTEVPICNDSLLPNERKEHFKTMHLLLVSNAAFTHKVFLDDKSIWLWNYIILHTVWKSHKKVLLKLYRPLILDIKVSHFGKGNTLLNPEARVNNLLMPLLLIHKKAASAIPFVVRNFFLLELQGCITTLSCLIFAHSDLWPPYFRRLLDSWERYKKVFVAIFAWWPFLTLFSGLNKGFSILNDTVFKNWVFAPKTTVKIPTRNVNK